MKPGIIMLRILLLVFVISVFPGKAGANGKSFNAFEKAGFEASVLPVMDLGDNHAFNFLSDSILITKNPQAISLTVLISQSRIAQLSWINTPPDTDGFYYVERREAGIPNWIVLEQLPFTTLQYNDTISYPYCQPLFYNFYYRIRHESSVSGTAISDSVAGNGLFDNTPPGNVNNVLVSVVFTNSNIYYPVITWTPASGNDITGYEINRSDGFIWAIIDTVPSDSLRFVDQTTTDACNKSLTYEIITIDSCGGRSTPGYAPRQTIKLNMPPIDDCERLAKLSWNSYNLMPGGLGGYKVYRDENGNPIEIADITDTLITTFVDSINFENGKTYTYFVQAYSASGTAISSSCRQGWLYSGANVPDSVYITKVSVENDRDIRIYYHSSPDATVKRMMLERSDDGGLTFQTIDSLVVFTGNFVLADYYMDDKTADVHSQSYSYRLKAVDFCETNILTSAVSLSIFLIVNPTQTENIVDWNSYETWMQGVEGYKLYRTVDGQPVGGEIMGSFAPYILTYPDPLTGVDPTKEVCYWVVAQEKPGNPYITNAESTSNIYCLLKGATVFMPNAFHPAGINDRFRPIASFVDPQSFTMIIFNRWGQQVFETSDMVNGWDGVINGQYAPQGLYAYKITYKSTGGQDYTKRGTVYVVR